MNNNDIVAHILYNYEDLGINKIEKLCKKLPNKIIRWLGAYHPDNKIRKIFFRLTNIEIGKGTVINLNFIVSDGFLPLLKIGNRVSISPNVSVICQSEPNNSYLKNICYVVDMLICNKEVIINDDVWIGTGAVILPGVVIGEKAIIGAGAVVTKNVDPKSIVAGIPATLIRVL